MPQTFAFYFQGKPPLTATRNARVKSIGSSRLNFLRPFSRNTFRRHADNVASAGSRGGARRSRRVAGRAAGTARRDVASTGGGLAALPGLQPGAGNVVSFQGAGSCRPTCSSARPAANAICPHPTAGAGRVSKRPNRSCRERMQIVADARMSWRNGQLQSVLLEPAVHAGRRHDHAAISCGRPAWSARRNCCAPAMCNVTEAALEWATTA